MVGVLYIHFWNNEPSLENTRVNLFFAISGYLITANLLMAAPRRGGTQIVNFYVRRLLRLMPPILMALAFAVIYDRSFMQPSILWHVFQLTNVHVYLSNTWDPWVTAHFWSLNVLEQYYLVWPLLIILVPRRLVILVVAALLILPFFLRAAVPVIGPDVLAIRVLPFFVFDAIAGGAMLAIILSVRPASLNLLAKPFVGFAAITVVALSIYSERFLGPSEIVRVFGILSIVALVGGASIGFPGLFGLIFGNRIFTYLGRISYGIYIYHTFVWWVVANAVPPLYQPGWATFLVVSAITGLLASLSWHFVESPINSLKRYFPVGSQDAPPSAELALRR